MKRTFLINRLNMSILALLLGVPLPLNAQVVINPEDIPTEAGTIIPFYITSSIEGIEVDLGGEGQHQLWDFNQYISDTIVSDQLIDPIEAPNAEDFPTANRVVQPGQGGGFGLMESLQYEVVADTGWYLIGYGFDLGGLFGFPLVFPGGLLRMPMPAQYGDEWEVSESFNYFYTSDTLAFDTLRIETVFGGFSEINASGTVQFPGGEVQALRQHTTLGIVVNAYAIQWVFGIRIEIPLGEWFRLDANQTYSWYAPGLGEIATITSMPLEEDPEFTLASSVRVRFLPPQLEFPQNELDFGEVVVNHPGQAQLTVLNHGEGFGLIDQIEIDPALEGLVEVVDELPILVEPEEETLLTFRWTPIALGEMAGEIQLYHNDMELENPVTIQLNGLAIEGPHFEAVEPTGTSYFIAVNEALYNGVSLVAEDEIGVFDGDLCVGAVTITEEGFPVQLAAWRANPELGLPGYTNGNPIGFRLWKEALGVDVEAQATFLQGNGTFGHGLFSAVTLTAGGAQPEEMVLPLRGRYFELISTYLVPEDLNASDVFGNIAHLAIVYQNDGRIFIPLIINTIGNITVTQGYQIYCEQASEFRLTGNMIDPVTPYILYPNRWNWLGYPFAVPTPIQTALADIEDEVIIIMNDDGQLWIPQALNTIGNMQPGVGYFAFVSSQVTFQYHAGAFRGMNTGSVGVPACDIPACDIPACGSVGVPACDIPACDAYELSLQNSSSSPQTQAPRLTLPTKPLQPTGLPYAVLVHLDGSLAIFDPMAIELYDGSLLVGRSKVLNDLDFTPIIAWQGSVDYGLPGFAKGHQIHCRVLNVEGTEVPVTCLEPYQYYGEGAFTELTLSLKEVALPGQFKVGAPFPNPFNPATTLVFELPANGIVGIIMYNTLGQVISRSQTFYKAGQNTYVFNAMKAGNELVSGVYFVQLQYRDQIVTRKLLLMK